jgi:predicted small lipoprotein YifL
LKYSRTWLPWVVLGAVLVMPSCGKKGPPFLPKKPFDASVRNLQGQQQAGSVFLKGQVVGEKGKDSVQGARVDYARYPLDEPPCEGCPIEYRGSHGFGPEVVTGTTFACEVPVERKGEIYYFRVHLLGPDGAVGPPSNAVRVVID